MDIRTLFGYGDRHELPSRYWEPEPDDEDQERLEREYDGDDTMEPLPFE